MIEKEKNNDKRHNLNIEDIHIKNHQFRDYNKKYIDEKSQYLERLHELEELIFKPQNSSLGINSLTEQELEEYLKIDLEKLKENNVNMKTIVVCMSTQKLIRENKDDILEKIRKNHKGDKGEEEIER